MLCNNNLFLLGIKVTFTLSNALKTELKTRGMNIIFSGIYYEQKVQAIYLSNAEEMKKVFENNPTY